MWEPYSVKAQTYKTAIEVSFKIEKFFPYTNAKCNKNNTGPCGSYIVAQRYFQVVTVLPPGVKWRIPPCGVYPLVSKKSGVLDFTIVLIK